MKRIAKRAVVVCYAATLLFFAEPGLSETRAAEMRVGAAVIDVTPPKGYRMSGYYYERLNTGVHDPLWAKALVFEQGERRAAIVVCDLVGMSATVTDAARRAAMKQTGIPASNIMISATHTHTGPLYFGALRDHFHQQAVSKQGRDPHEELDYPAELAKKLAEVIARAQRAAAPARIQAGSAAQQGLSFNRRFHMKDGSVRFNPGKLNPDIIRPAGPIDPEVGIVLFSSAEDNLPLGGLTVFALHLDTVGGTEYGGDYPFYLEQSLRRTLGKDFVSVFGTGTCGDINHVDVSHNRPQKGQEEAERIGLALGATVTAALGTLSPVAAPDLDAREAVVNVPLQKYPADKVAEARRNMSKVGTRELGFLEQVEAVKIVTLAEYEKDSMPLSVQVFRLGPETAVVGLPGEVFVDLGLAIKQASPFEVTLVVELSNDAPKYVPTKKAFVEGSYETVNSLVQSGGGEMLVETAARLLKELDPKGK